MSRTLVVRPQARLEMAEASDWYDARDKGLGDTFLRAFDAATDSILRNPMQYQVIFANARRLGLGNVHTSRDPRLWQSRLR